jgi:integration host factor subunit alpha
MLTPGGRDPVGTMNRDLLSKRISIELRIPLPLARSLVNSMLARLREALQTGDELKIREFGTFDTGLRSAGQGRNPRRGQPYPISARRVVTFKPGKRLARQSRRTPRPDRCPQRYRQFASGNQRRSRGRD